MFVMWINNKFTNGLSFQVMGVAMPSNIYWPSAPTFMPGTTEDW